MLIQRKSLRSVSDRSNELYREQGEKITRLESELATFKDQVVCLEEKIKELDSLYAREEIEELLEEKQSLNYLSSTLKSEISYLKARNTQKDGEIEALNVENSALKTEKAGLQEENHIKDRQFRVVTTERDEAQAKIEELKELVDPEIEKRLCDAKIEVHRLKITENQNSINDLSANISSLQTTHLAKRVGEVGLGAGLPAVYIPSMLAAATFAGPVGGLGV